MKLITSRVLFAFGLLVALILIVSTYLLSQQSSATQKFRYTAHQLFPLAHEEKDIELQVLTVNKLTNEHANSLDDDLRKQLKNELKILISAVSSTLEQHLQNSERLISQTSESVLVDLFKAQRQQVLALVEVDETIFRSLNQRSQALDQLQAGAFSKKLRFTKALRKLESGAAEDIDFTLNEAASFLSHMDKATKVLLRIPTIVDPWEVEDAKSELDSHLYIARELADKMSERHTQLSKSLQAYTSVFEQASGGADGLYQSQVSWLEGNTLRVSLYDQYRVTLDQILKQLHARTEQVDSATAEMMAAIDTVTQRSFTLGIILVLVAVVIASVVGTRIFFAIRNPLQATVSALSRLSNGELHTQLPIQSRNEFGTIAQHVNELSDNLRAAMSSVILKSQQVETLVGKSESTNAEVLNLSNQQMDMINAIDQSAQQMQSSTQSVDEALNHIGEHVAKLIDFAEESRRGSDHNVASIHQLENNISNSASTIHELSTATENIGNILSVIQTIAEQTNLLALNAAIEAARAGEQGRGFAVVADEVRNLATKTRDSTAEIYSVIESLQANSKTAVALMGDTQNVAKQCVDSSEYSKAKIDELEQVITALKQQNTAVGNYSNEQSHLIATVTHKLSHIVSSAQSTGSAINNASQCNAELVKVTHEERELLKQFKV